MITGSNRVFEHGGREFHIQVEDLARVRQLELPAPRDSPHVARAREGSALAADDRAGLFGLAIDLADVDAPDLPQRGGLGWQRCAAADDQAKCVEPELVENGSKRRGARQRIDKCTRAARFARPSSARVRPCEPHRSFVHHAFRGA